MGIPRLTALLHPYAAKTEWKRQNTPSAQDSGSKLVIDGPALAYFIYYQCLTSKSSATNALEAMPSYARLAEAVVEWLNEIERFGVTVKHIFFDGVLPSTKRHVRLERLGSSLDQLRKFRILHPEVCPQHVSHRVAGGSRPPSSQLRALPASPFLVPAILEALLASKYARITEVVPCEADLKCSDSTISTSADYILTGDSDLIVHHPPGRIVMFNDLPYHGQLKTTTSLVLSYYDPYAIALRFELPNLLLVAYLIKQDPHLPFTESVKKAQQTALPADENGQFAEFCHEYEEYDAPHLDHDSSCPPNHVLMRLYKELDPRISELAQNWTQSQTFGVTSSLTLSMYLPFLIDDPTRASAWRASTFIRHCAYSVLTVGQHIEVSEVDRRGLRITETPLVLIKSRNDLASALTALTLSITRTRAAIHDAPEVSQWRMFALCSVLQVLKEDEASFPSRQRVDRVFLHYLGQHTWGQVHLAAQTEACLYSLRILRQILEVALASPQLWAHGSADTQPFKCACEILLQHLQSLPALARLHTTPGGRLPLGIVESSVASELARFFPVKQKAEQEAGLSENKRKKKRRNESQAVPVKLDKSNMFSILGD